MFLINECTQSYYVHVATQYSNNNVFVFKISEELEKVKQEMEEKGSSMSDGGKPHTQNTLSLYWWCSLFMWAGVYACPCVLWCSSSGEDPSEFDQAEAGDWADGCSDGSGGAHVTTIQTQREKQHDQRHACYTPIRAQRTDLLSQTQSWWCCVLYFI